MLFLLKNSQKQFPQFITNNLYIQSISKTRIAKAQAPLTLDKSAIALRRANNYNAPITLHQRHKLAQVAKPFQDLLTQLTSPPPSTSLAFGLSPHDLSSLPNHLTNLNTDSDSSATARILALDMQDGSQTRRHIMQQAMNMFARRPNDTGSPEVQAALWSIKIAALLHHTSLYRHDYVAERKIQEWKDARRKILKYLKRISLQRYLICVDRLGLPHDTVEPYSWRFPTPPMVRPKSAAGQKKLLARQGHRSRRK